MWRARVPVFVLIQTSAFLLNNLRTSAMKPDSHARWRAVYPKGSCKLTYPGGPFFKRIFAICIVSILHSEPQIPNKERKQQTNLVRNLPILEVLRMCSDDMKRCSSLRASIRSKRSRLSKRIGWNQKTLSYSVHSLRSSKRCKSTCNICCIVWAVEIEYRKGSWNVSLIVMGNHFY